MDRKTTKSCWGQSELGQIDLTPREEQLSYYDVSPPVKLGTELGEILAEMAGEPDCGLRVNYEGYIDRVDLVHSFDVTLFNNLFSKRAQLVETEEEL